jgi:hypothetical protein
VNRCPEVPDTPQDGDRFTCPRCGYSAEFVVLDDGKPGEWVGMTQPETPESPAQPSEED